MKGMHGIIFSYGEKPGLGQLTANRIHGSLPFAPIRHSSMLDFGMKSG